MKGTHLIKTGVCKLRRRKLEAINFDKLEGRDELFVSLLSQAANSF